MRREGGHSYSQPAARPAYLGSASLIVDGAGVRSDSVIDLRAHLSLAAKLPALRVHVEASIAFAWCRTSAPCCVLGAGKDTASDSGMVRLGARNRRDTRMATRALLFEEVSETMEAGGDARASHMNTFRGLFCEFRRSDREHWLGRGANRAAVAAGIRCGATRALTPC